MQHFSNIYACQLRKTSDELFSISTELEQKKSQSLAGAILRFNGMSQQAAADETDLLVNNADAQEVDDLQEDDFSEALREDLQEGTNGLDTDESSVNQFDLIANLLLEPEAVAQRCSIKKVFLEILQNS